MPKYMKRLNKPGDRDYDHESMRPPVVESVARQIAILVVRQHRRLRMQDGKKNGENAVY